MIVVDASAVIEVLLNRPIAVRVRERFFRRREELTAPHLLDVEVLQVIRRYALRKEIAAERAAEAVARYREMNIERYAHELLIPRIWSLRSSFTAYDAAYVALAELLEAPLITTDARLARSSGARHVAELIQ